MVPSAYTLKMAEIKKLYIAAPTFRDRCIIKTLFWLGLRRQELIDVDIRDIDFDRKRVQVRAGKGDKTPKMEGPVFTSTQGTSSQLSPRIINHIVGKPA